MVNFPLILWGYSITFYTIAPIFSLLNFLWTHSCSVYISMRHNNQWPSLNHMVKFQPSPSWIGSIIWQTEYSVPWSKLSLTWFLLILLYFNSYWSSLAKIFLHPLPVPLFLVFLTWVSQKSSELNSWDFFSIHSHFLALNIPSTLKMLNLLANNGNLIMGLERKLSS